MTYITNLINPPNKSPSTEQSYRFNNNVNDVNKALNYIMNPSVLSNANFSTLGS